MMKDALPQFNSRTGAKNHQTVNTEAAKHLPAGEGFNGDTRPPRVGEFEGGDKASRAGESEGGDRAPRAGEQGGGIPPRVKAIGGDGPTRVGV